MSNALPVSRLINVDVNLSPAAAQSQALDVLLILGSSVVIDTEERIRTYGSITEVAADFGTSAPEYLAANLWFQQTPQPSSISIGRWAESATAGILRGAPLSTAQQLISNFTAVSNGGFVVTIDGGAPQAVTGLDFSAVTNLNGVASEINSVMTGATIAWDANNARFTITSDTTGASSTVSFLTTPATSFTDISSLLAMRSTSSGAYVVDGIVAETPVACVTLFDDEFPGQFYGVMFAASLTNDEHLEVAAFIEAADIKHIYGITTQEAGALVANNTTNIAYLTQLASYKRTTVQYSSSSPYAVASLLGRILTVDYDGNATVITLMYKQEPGITAETLTTTQANALQGFNCNVFVAYNNNTAIIQYGTVASGDFLDIITGTDWLATDIQTAVYNLLYTSTTKVPQTDAGNNLIQSTIAAVCSQGVANGLMAPGTWNASGFGQLNQGDFLPDGFYIFAPSIALQSQSDREARRSVPFQVAAKLAGAIHTVDVIVNVNR